MTRNLLKSGQLKSLDQNSNQNLLDFKAYAFRIYLPMALLTKREGFE